MTSGLPQLSFQVAFTGTKAGVTVSANPNDPAITPIWTDLTRRLVSFNVKRGKQAEMDESQAADNSVRLRNSDAAFDPDNTSSPYSPYVLPFRQYRIQLTYASTTYTVATGYVESWDQTWDKHGVRGWVDCTLTDAFGLLSQMILISCLSSEVVLDNPVAYWPLSEPSSVNVGQNLAVTGAGQMAALQYGTGGTMAFGATTLAALVGAGASNGEAGPIQGNTTGPSLTPGSAPGQGVGLSAPLNAYYSPSNLTVEFWVQGVANTSPYVQTLLTIDNNNIVIANAGTVYAVARNSTGGSYSQATGSSIQDGNLHHVAVTLTNVGGAGTLTIYVDGALVQATSMTSAAIGTANINLTAAVTPSTLVFSNVAFYTTALSSSRIAAHYNAGVNAFPEATSARFARILSYAPWTGSSTIPGGNSNLMGLTDCSGKSALAALEDVVKAEQGNMFVSAAGSVVFENRNNRITQITPQFRFTDQPSTGTDLTYVESPTVVRDPATIYNAIIVQRPGGGTYRFFDQASILQNFPRAHPDNPLELPIDTDQNLQYAAQFIIGRYKNTWPRVEGLKIVPSAAPSLYPLVASLEIGQRVTFVRSPRDATSPISQDFFIEQIEHAWDISPGSTPEYAVTVQLSPAAWSRYGILTAARGTLNASTLAGATSFVVNVTPTSGNTLAQDGWTKSAMPTIKIYDPTNGTETLTVSTMTTSGSQATITTTAGAAFAHGAGVTVAENYSTALASTNDTVAVLDGLHQVGW